MGVAGGFGDTRNAVLGIQKIAVVRPAAFLLRSTTARFGALAPRTVSYAEWLHVFRGCLHKVASIPTNLSMIYI